MLWSHRALIESGVPMALVIGTACDGAPTSSRGSGALIEDDETLRVSVADIWAEPLRTHLARNAALALSFANIETYQTLQCKGELLEIVDVEDRDRGQCERFHAAMVRGVEGWMPTVVHMVNRADFVLRVRVRQLFDQTPGPAAGRVLV